MKSKTLFSITSIALMLSLSGCSNFKSLVSNSTSLDGYSHPLKTKKDLRIERLLASGTWKYQRQGDDCKDTFWQQQFYPSRYYQSKGSACKLIDAFSVEAESWHVKNQHLYIVNLAPVDGNDIILKYGIDYLDSGKLILSSNGYKYTFLK